MSYDWCNYIQLGNYAINLTSVGPLGVRLKAVVSGFPPNLSIYIITCWLGME